MDIQGRVANLLRKHHWSSKLYTKHSQVNGFLVGSNQSPGVPFERGTIRISENKACMVKILLLNE